MPLNDYQCEKCKAVFEVLDVRRSDVKETLTCEHCGKGIAKKIMGKTSFKLAGECWASDGYGRDYTNFKCNSKEKKGKGKVNVLGKGLDSMTVKK